MKVTYVSHARNRVRCNLIHLYTQPTFLIVNIAAAAIYEAFGAIAIHMTLKSYLTWLPVSVLGYLAFCVPVVAALAANQKTNPKIVSYVLNRDGIEDLGTEPSPLRPWTSFTKITNVAGDTFLSAKPNGIYVPRNAFANDALRRRFFEAVLAAHRGDYSQIEDGEDLGVDAAKVPTAGGPMSANPQVRAVAAAYSAARAESGNKAALAFSAVILACGIGIVTYAQIRRSEYVRSPACIPGAHTDAALSPCTLEHMTIVKKSVTYGSHGATYYILALSNPARDASNVRVSSSFYAAAYDDEQVTAKSWRGKIVVVTDSTGHRADTADYPGQDAKGELIVILGLIAVLINLRKVAADYRRHSPAP